MTEAATGTPHTANGARPGTGTPLTAFGSRVAQPATRPRTTTVNPAAAGRASTPTPRQAQPATATATVRTMIVLLPDALPHEPLTAHTLDRHFGVHGILQPRYWASTRLRMWQRQQMVLLRKGSPAYCAGGPVRLLDLTGLRHAAGVGAGIRHQVFTAATRGTRPAWPWHAYQAKHDQYPDRYSLADAARDFYAQPRITAMRMHNAVNPTAGHLDPTEVEMYQAGQMAYQYYSAATAICGDALLTDDGRRVAPASDALTDRTTYIEQAMRLLETLDDEQRLIAVTL
jgi:hypothetical protein